MWRVCFIFLKWLQKLRNILCTVGKYKTFDRNFGILFNWAPSNVFIIAETILYIFFGIIIRLVGWNVTKLRIFEINRYFAFICWHHVLLRGVVEYLWRGRFVALGGDHTLPNTERMLRKAEFTNLHPIGMSKQQSPSPYNRM